MDNKNILQQAKNAANDIVNHWLKSDFQVYSPVWNNEHLVLREKFIYFLNQLEKKEYNDSSLEEEF